MCPLGGYYPVYACPVADWSSHMAPQRLPLVLVVACSFRVLLDKLESLRFAVQHTSLWLVYRTIKGVPAVVWVDSNKDLSFSTRCGLCCTWSTLVWAIAWLRVEHKALVPQLVCARLALVYLQNLHIVLRPSYTSINFAVPSFGPL